MPKLKVYSPEAAYTVAPHGGLKAIEVPGYRMQCDAYVVASSKAKAAAYFAEAGGHSSAPHFHESGRSGDTRTRHQDFIKFHGEIDGRWQLVLAVRPELIHSIRDKATEEHP